MKSVLVTGGSGFLGRRLIPNLIERGYRVRALARSDDAARIVEGLGAESVRGDLDDTDALTRAMAGCTYVLHGAAHMAMRGAYEKFHRVNVSGTERVLAVARASSSVERLVYVGAAAVIQGRAEVRNADETWPLQKLPYAHYAATKALADEAVRAANGDGLTTCVLRPGWIWGPGDAILANMVGAAREGKMMLIDRGAYPIVTSHIDNVCRAVLLAFERGRGGEAYFVFDDGEIQQREWITRLLDAYGVAPPTRSIPYGVAWSMASAMELAWRALGKKSGPPITRAFVRLTGRIFSVSDRKARAELGYAPETTREHGLRQLVALGG